MGKIKIVWQSFAQATPFILSNTIIFVPYLLYIHLIDGRDIITVLPFVLFYTFRMTGIFLIRSLQRSIEKYTLLILALLLGGCGSLLSLIGTLYTPIFILASICLGLSAALFPPANVSVNYFEKAQGEKVTGGKTYLLGLILLLPLFYGLSLPINGQLVIVSGLYTLYFVLAYHTIRHFPHYELDFKDLSKNVFSPKELIWFSLFFVAIFLLRSGRILFKEVYLNIAILIFCLIFLLSVYGVKVAKRSWHLPLWVNMLTFFNGMCGNFLILFGTFYTAAVYGKQTLSTHLFLPYFLGIICAMLFGGKVGKLLDNPLHTQLMGFSLGLISLFYSPVFPLAIGVLSFFHSTTSSWLNQWYYQQDAIEAEQRIIAKYATSNKGSITHQFLLMVFLLLILRYDHFPMNELFSLPNLQQGSKALGAVMITVKNGSSIFMIIWLAIIGKVGQHAFDH
ncbi:hypothetical protein [Enterococcus sp. AZ072]|uniref:hypothetical protein n=1 Tax=unclassified Enterococcus TaxID=2608891 RepID=UPI003D2C069C